MSKVLEPVEKHFTNVVKFYQEAITNWPLKTLDQLGYLSRGRSRHRPRDAAHLYGGQYPFIQTADVKHANLYITEYSQTYSEAGLAQSRLWKKGTLCITIAANIADTAILGFDACFPDSVIGYIADEEQADTRFIKYLFDSLLQSKFKQFSHGVAQDNLSQEKLLSIQFPVPPLITQQKIVSILSTYDDLIENNRRRIALLEQSARLLYKEWFVRFRFPGHEHVRMVDGLPEGWEKLTASEILHINPEEKLEKGKVIKHIPMSALSLSDMTIDFEELDIRDKATSPKFRNDDVIFARITPCLENGKTGFVNFLGNDEVACGSTEFIVLRGKLVSPQFAYCFARTEDFREHAIKSMIGSSGRQRVQDSCFDNYYLPLPPDSLLEPFQKFAEQTFTQIKVLQAQSLKLKNVRDILLPRLMNGEIEV